MPAAVQDKRWRLPEFWRNSWVSDEGQPVTGVENKRILVNQHTGRIVGRIQLK